MRIPVGRQRLFVEVVGTKLREKASGTTEVPTIVLLHGGPAWDHRTLLGDFRDLAEEAQLIFFDHRGLGRSDRSSRGHWTLQTWAADVAALIDSLGLVRPIILGQSFGGIVAQRFAVDFPDLYSGLILSSTAARFELEPVIRRFAELGGERLGELARDFFTGASPQSRDRFLLEGMPFYTVTRKEIGAAIPTDFAVLDHFFGFGGEAHCFDFRADLSSVTKPVLIIGGKQDPAILPEAVRELAGCFAPGFAQCILLDDCGHGPARDKPAEAMALLREFLHANFIRASAAAPDSGSDANGH